MAGKYPHVAPPRDRVELACIAYAALPFADNLCGWMKLRKLLIINCLLVDETIAFNHCYILVGNNDMRVGSLRKSKLFCTLALLTSIANDNLRGWRN